MREFGISIVGFGTIVRKLSLACLEHAVSSMREKLGDLGDCGELGGFGGSDELHAFEGLRSISGRLDLLLLLRVEEGEAAAI